MNRSAYWNTSLILFTCCAIGAASSKTSKVADTATIAVTIKSDVAQFVAGLNAHDVAKGTAFDAPNIIAIQCGSAPMVGADADRAGFKEMFDHDPSWKARLMDENVDVASSGDLDVYRGTYHEDSSRAGVPMTHKTNFLAEFKRQSGGPWQMVWYSVSSMEPSHPK